MCPPPPFIRAPAAVSDMRCRHLGGALIALGLIGDTTRMPANTAVSAGRGP